MTPKNIDRPLKAIIELFSQYRKISIWSPQYRHIDDVFLSVIVIVDFLSKKLFFRPKTRMLEV